MEFEDIERILELVRAHDLAEFELEREGLKLRVREERHGAPRAAAGPGRTVAAAAGSRLHQPPAAAAAVPLPPVSIEGDDTVELAVVKSPIVGTFYRSSDPGAASFVDIGDQVKKDQVPVSSRR